MQLARSLLSTVVVVAAAVVSVAQLAVHRAADLVLLLTGIRATHDSSGRLRGTPVQADGHFWNVEVPLMDSSEFRSHFRMERATFDSLVLALSTSSLLKPVEGRGRPRIPVAKQVAVYLWRMSTDADSLRTIRQLFGVAISSITRICERVAETIIEELSADAMRFPLPAEMAGIAAKFERMSGFPGVIACLDGTLIPINKPSVDGDAYISRHEDAAFACQAAVGPDFRVLDAHIGTPGSYHDQRTFRRSMLYVHGERRIPEGYVVLSDSAYTPKRWLIPSFKKARNSKQRRFNVLLNRTRVTVEQFFGAFKSRFRRFNTRVVTMNVEEGILFCKSCIVLWNYLVDAGEYMHGSALEDDAKEDGADGSDHDSNGSGSDSEEEPRIDVDFSGSAMSDKVKGEWLRNELVRLLVP